MTGRSTSGLDHLYQSISKILTTPRGSCIQRRDFGSDLLDLVDAPSNGATRVRLYAATAAALMQWEPRVSVTRVQLSADSVAGDQQIIDIEGFTTESGEAISTSVNVTNGSAA